jgi:integrase
MPELLECLETIAERSPSIANICRFLAYSGWRVSDAMDLRWGEVEMAGPRAIGKQIDRDQIKTQDGLTYPVTPPIRACLETALAGVDGRPKAADYVFLEAQGSPWTYNALYRRLTRTLAAANFPRQVSPHVFRTTFATLAASSDPPVPPRVLQNLLGHRDLKDTLQYYTEVQLGDLARWSAHVSGQISGLKRI